MPCSHLLRRPHSRDALQRVRTAGHAGNLAFQRFTLAFKFATRPAPDVAGLEDRNREYGLMSEDQRTCDHDEPKLEVWQR